MLLLTHLLLIVAKATVDARTVQPLLKLKWLISSLNHLYSN